ncbi:MAG: hypothetical protein EXS09_05275 [Gemmataceae bacterium]|nr:hypothetical protein [Gemmataceae bacterium]
MPRSTLPLAYHWDNSRPPPRLSLRLSKHRQIAVPEVPAWIETGNVGRPFDFSAAMHRLCEDVTERSEAFGHLDLSRILFTITRARTGTKHGLQAKVTPLRFEGGALATNHRSSTFQVQRFVVDGRDMLYLVSFCLPRFMNRDFHDKLVTVFHELHHISPEFDGTIRRHEGRYSTHTSSQKRYDAHMAKLVKKYLANEADESRNHFLRLSFAELCQRHGSIVGNHLPRPKLIRVPHSTPPSR